MGSHNEKLMFVQFNDIKSQYMDGDISEQEYRSRVDNLTKNSRINHLSISRQESPVSRQKATSRSRLESPVSQQKLTSISRQKSPVSRQEDTSLSRQEETSISQDDTSILRQEDKSILQTATHKRVQIQLQSDVKTIQIPNKSNVKKWAKDGSKINKTTKLSIKTVHAGFQGPSGIVDMVDTFDRKGNAYANDTYARAGTYASAFTNKPGKRIPKAGAYAEAGVGEAHAEFSVFQAQAKGPNAGARAGASATGLSAMATAGLGAASANAGPIGVKVGLQLDTGASVGIDGIEVKILGIGFSLGPKTSISFLGNEISLDLV